MDATPQAYRQGSKRHRMAVVAVALFTFTLCLPDAGAQVFRLRSRDGDQAITHSLTTAPQSFSPVRWDIQNARFRNGCVVQWTADAFTHESDPAARADCEVSLRLIQDSKRARWTIASDTDSTKVSAGKDSAAVSIAADARGNARVELLLRFVHDNVNTLAAGNYHTTLTGTITGL